MVGTYILKTIFVSRKRGVDDEVIIIVFYIF